MTSKPSFPQAWQKGRVEQHGQIIKNMLHRYDQEKIIEGPTELDQVLRACFQAKNALSRHQGFSPEQIVLGKSTRLPASLSSDENASAHCLADGSDLECERFQRNLEARSQARKMFLLADNDASIRRAILRKSNPHPGIFVVGQSVMYLEDVKWGDGMGQLALCVLKGIRISGCHMVTDFSGVHLKIFDLRLCESGMAPMFRLINR